MSETISIRDIRPSDEADWRSLWDGYNSFYETSVAPEITSRTWQRMLNPTSPLLGRIALIDDTAVGFSLSVLHEGTWVAGQICYLEDLFVDPAGRGRGIGRTLIRDLVDRGTAQGWSTLYWHTRENNPARRLFDKFVEADDFVRYRLHL